jgi:hypothetical protein
MNDPVRIVHLIDPSSAGHDALRACAACLMMRDVDQQVWLVGSSEDERTALRLGVDTTDRVGLTLGVAALTARRVRELARVRLRSGDVARTIVQCWSVRTVRLAQRALEQSVSIQLTLATGPDAHERTSSARRLGLEGVAVRVIGAALAELWRQRGVDVVDVLDWPRAAPAQTMTREALRAELRLREDEFAILLLGDPPASCDARHFAGALSLLNLAAVRVVGLVPSGASEVRRAARFYQRFHRAWEGISFDGPASLAIPAADLVLWDVDPARAARISGQPMGGQLGALEAMRAGVPIVAARSALSESLLLAQAGACLAERTALPALGERILNLALDRQLHRATAQALVARASEIDHASHFWSQVRQGWGVPSKPTVRVALAGA